MKKVKVGIIGLGRIVCDGHIPAIQKNEKFFELIAISNLEEREKGEIIAVMNNCKYYNNYMDMIDAENLDLIVVATYSCSHTEIARNCLTKKINVLLEKPLAINVPAGKEICDMAVKNNIKLYTSYQRRFNRYFQTMKNMLEKKLLGDIMYCSCRSIHYRSNEYYYRKEGGDLDGGGVLINQAIHLVDMLCYLFGDLAVVRKKLKCIKHNINYEDWAKVELLYDEIDIMFWATTCAEKEHGYELNLWGTNGFAKLTNCIFEYGYWDENHNYIKNKQEYFLSNVDLLEKEYEDIYKEMINKEFISSQLCHYDAGVASLSIIKEIYK